jgi:glycosyltransferase involved in cell wall biosynthesis
MKILHVTLGDPNNHQGGLNEYCRELMEMEDELGNDVLLLFPGKSTFLKRTRIRKVANRQYNIENPLPVAITYGIDHPSRYMLKPDEEVYSNWLDEVHPDIIHVHSIQGIHKEFFEVANKKRIPIVFTTHDFYPICCKCNLVMFDQKQCKGPRAKKCAICNYGMGLSANKQRVIKSKTYQMLKKNKIINSIKKNMQRRNGKSISIEFRNPSNESVNAFNELIHYYYEMISCVTIIHANSVATSKIYGEYFSNTKCKVIPITHNNLNNDIHVRKNNETVYFGYFGGMNKEKGYEQVLNVCKLLQNIPGWKIDLYGGVYPANIKNEHIEPHGYFSQEEAVNVWKSIDVLIVPSQCRETFGFAVLEGLSHKIPVICSDLVGSRYLIENIEPNNIYHYKDTEFLALRMKQYINKEFYDNQVEKLSNIELPNNMTEHTKKILELYKEAQESVMQEK